MESVIELIVRLEWEMFQEVENIGGRASCQDDFETFSIMRRSQFESFNEDICQNYLIDLLVAIAKGKNLIYEKYGYMMLINTPDDIYTKRLKLTLPSGQIREYAQKIVNISSYHREKLKEKYPLLLSRGRLNKQDTQSQVSFYTYFLCELLTYSKNTLESILKYYLQLENNGENIAEKNLLPMVKSYGYQNLQDAENHLMGEKNI